MKNSMDTCALAKEGLAQTPPRFIQFTSLTCLVVGLVLSTGCAEEVDFGELNLVTSVSQALSASDIESIECTVTDITTGDSYSDGAPISDLGVEFAFQLPAADYRVQCAGFDAGQTKIAESLPTPFTITSNGNTSVAVTLLSLAQAQQAPGQANLGFDFEPLPEIAGVTVLPTNPRAQEVMSVKAYGVSGLLPSGSVAAIIESLVDGSIRRETLAATSNCNVAECYKAEIILTDVGNYKVSVEATNPTLASTSPEIDVTVRAGSGGTTQPTTPSAPGNAGNGSANSPGVVVVGPQLALSIENGTLRVTLDGIDPSDDVAGAQFTLTKTAGVAFTSSATTQTPFNLSFNPNTGIALLFSLSGVTLPGGQSEVLLEVPVTGGSTGTVGLQDVTISDPDSQAIAVGASSTVSF